MNVDTLTIVNGDEGDDTVIINGEGLQFLVDDLLPLPNIWAVQYKHGRGEIEFRDTNEPHEIFEDVALFQDVIEKFFEVKEERAVESAKVIEEQNSVETIKARLAREELDAQRYLQE